MNASTLCAYNKDQTGAHRIGMKRTKSWARNRQALWKWWLTPSYYIISSQPRAWNTPRLNGFEYTILSGPLSQYCVHNLSLPWIRMAAFLLNSSVPRSLVAPSGYVWI